MKPRELLICTPEERKAAHRFLDLTINAQAEGVAALGCCANDILGQIHDEYHSAMYCLLKKRKRIECLNDTKTSVQESTIVISKRNSGFILQFKDVLANGQLDTQAKCGFRWSDNDPSALAYQVRMTKKQVTLTAYFGFPIDEPRPAWYRQHIDVSPDRKAFLCPMCGDRVSELFIHDGANWNFACVTCHTVLDGEVRKVYERTRRGGRAAKGGAK